MQTINVLTPFIHYIYIGTAAERAGLAAPGVYSRFIETDSGNEYRWGGGAWQAIQASGVSSVATTGAGINIAASADVNLAVVADVDAAVAAAAGLRLVGFAAKESAATAAAATFNIVSGATAAGGTLLVPVELSANESARGWFGPDGIDAVAGVSIDWVAGAVDVVLFYKIVS
mgnify:CR=1 FL=1